MRLSLIILSFGRDQRFRPLLDGLLQGGVSPGDVLVVHNPYGAGDRWLPSVPEGVAVRRMPANVGYGAAMNAGIRDVAGRSDAVLLLTHDTRMDADALRHLWSAFESAPEYGVLGPVVELQGRLELVSYGGSVDPQGEVGHLMAPPPVGPRGIADVPWLDGCAMLLRTAAIAQVGPLCARYFMYFEEVELCERMRAGGWRVGVVPAARASSESGMASRPAAFGYLFARNGLDWARAHGGARFALRFAGRQLRASWTELPKPGGRRFRNPQLRTHGTRLATGRVAGLCAGLAGVSGPPPAFLARTGDIAGEEP